MVLLNDLTLEALTAATVLLQGYDTLAVVLVSSITSTASLSLEVLSTGLWRSWLEYSAEHVIQQRR